MSLDNAVATLNGTDLPKQFKYARPTAQRRVRRVQTHGGVRIHTSPSAILQDRQIQFVIPDATEAELTTMRNLLSTIGVTTVAFVGYHTGDSYQVKFLVMDDAPSKLGNLFDISGTLEIVS